MTERIIYISGRTALNKDNSLQGETRYHKDCIQALKGAGHHVTRIGSARQGFTWENLKTDLRRGPPPNVVIANMHGYTEETGAHYVAPRDLLLAEDFYAQLGKASEGRPLSVFMFSCGSHGKIGLNVNSLPVGSTVATFGQADEVFGFDALPESFVPNSATDRPFAEHLLLNILSKGYENSTPYYPVISVSRPYAEKGKVLHLWRLATVGFDEKYYDSEIRTEIESQLSPYFSSSTLSQAFDQLNTFAKSVKFLDELSAGENEEIVKIKNMVAHSIYDLTREEGLIGASCAIGYCIHRRKVGAFLSRKDRSSAERPTTYFSQEPSLAQATV